MPKLPIFYRPEQSSNAANSYSPSAGKPALVMQDWMRRYGNSIDVHTFEPVSRDTLCLAHDPAYIDGLLSCQIANGFGNKNAEIAASLHYTVGSMVAASEHAVRNRCTAFSLTSGFHHANHDFGGGYCTVNGLVIAAIELKRRGLVNHVLIIDGDAHYGDGTTSCIRETGSDRWIKQITAGKDYDNAEQFFDAISQKKLMSKYEYMWDDIPSTLVIYQAGADAWVKDPLQSGVFTLKQLKQRDAQIIGLAKKFDIPLAINLAGGYSTDSAGTIEPVLKIHRQTIEAAINAYELHPTDPKWE